MRPVVRGPHPIDASSRQPKVFRVYGDAKEDLINRLGRYCCYCDSILSHAPEIDHVEPKRLFPDLENKWGNLLLSCKPCNTHKATQRIDHLHRPDRDATNRLLFVDFGVLVPHPSLTDAEQAEVRALLTIFNLNGPPCSIGDSRLENLHKTQVMAQRFAKKYAAGTLSVDDICRIALTSGFWLAWHQAFADRPEVSDALNRAFPGTALECFAADGSPVTRLGGRG